VNDGFKATGFFDLPAACIESLFYRISGFSSNIVPFCLRSIQRDIAECRFSVKIDTTHTVPASVVFGERVRSDNYWSKYDFRRYKKKGEGEDPLSLKLYP